MSNNYSFLTVAAFCAATLCSFPADGKPEKPHNHGENGKFLFDKETFAGNGRTCVTCHGKKTGTVSIDEIQERFAKDRSDPLFRSPDSDNLDGLSFDGLLATGTIRIDVPLA